jgi:DNA repair protein RecN (Recombination protein N)
LSEIKKKYDMTLFEIKEHSKKIKEEIDDLEDLENEIDKAKSEFDEASKKTSAGAVELSTLRKDAMLGLKEKVTIEMENLGFKSVIFDPRHDYIEDENGTLIEDRRLRFTNNGIDNIEFFISVNVGESARPLRKVASGGEISRIMLALKSVISSAYDISTMIFDEIDAGIGGATALVVGEKLFTISMNCQVLVITHLAQIACFSDYHYFIDKYIQNSRTKIKISRLEEGARIKEISRMIGGTSDSDISMMHAEELLEKCKNIKNTLLEGKIKVGN